MLSINDVMNAPITCTNEGVGGLSIGLWIGLGGRGMLTPKTFLFGLDLVLISPCQLVLAFSSWENIWELRSHSGCSDVNVMLT